MSDARISHHGDTEAPLAGTERLHTLSPEQLLTLFEQQDHAIFEAVQQAAGSIAELGTRMHRTLAAGGRVIHVGAGTSGRLGAVDAAEWPPTFGVPVGQVRAVIAGGDEALLGAVEGAEDDNAEDVLTELELAPRDLVNGISASGAARFVRSAVEFARLVGADRSWISSGSFRGDDEDLCQIVLPTGPEVLAGSTRLKAATATQLVLQRASNICAVLSGWVHAGRMVNMKPSNEKLRRRATEIVADLGQVDRERAERLLASCDHEIKTAIVCARRACAPNEAREQLAAVAGVLARLEGFQ